MCKHCGDFKLWIICLDKVAFNFFDKINLNYVNIISIEQFEFPELIALKKIRSKSEYCWTVTPFAPTIVFNTDITIESVTYLDADTYFLASPDPIFLEFINSNKQILITEHGFSPENDQSLLYGKFCVQFIIFNRDGTKEVLDTWQKQCLNWCYSRVENGKFGDQKYLDEWPKKFKSITHVLKNKHFMLAPWNVFRFCFSDAIFYHFHGLKIISKNKVFISQYKIPTVVINNIYLPYLRELKEAIKIMAKYEIYISPETNKFNDLIKKLSEPFINIKKFIYNFFNSKYINF